MENDPARLRQEQSAPLLADDAKVEYYDTTALDWLPATGRLRSAAETIYPYAAKALKGMDWLGGKVANGLGITSSRFQYAIDEYERRERRYLEKEARERQQARDRQRQAGMIDDDDSKMPYVPPVQLSFLPASQTGVGSGNGSNSSTSSNHNNQQSVVVGGNSNGQHKSAVIHLANLKKEEQERKKSSGKKNGNDDDDDDEEDDQKDRKSKKEMENL